jgi:hypothetical protein
VLACQRLLLKGKVERVKMLRNANTKVAETMLDRAGLAALKFWTFCDEA